MSSRSTTIIKRRVKESLENENAQDRIRRNIAIAKVNLDRMSEEFELILRRVCEDVNKGLLIKKQAVKLIEMSQDLFSQRQELQNMLNLLEYDNETVKSRIPEFKLKKIVSYYKTGDFTQADIATMFGYPVSIISLAIRKYMDDCGLEEIEEEDSFAKNFYKEK